MNCPPGQKKLASVDRWPLQRGLQDSIYGLSAGTKKSGRCRELAVGGGSTAYNNFRSAETKKCRTRLLPWPIKPYTPNT